MAFKFVRMLDGNHSPPMLRMPVDENTEFTKGDALMLSGGYLERHNGSGAAVVGVANKDVDTGAGESATVDVILATGNTVFEADVTGTPADTSLGYLADIQGDTGEMVINVASSTDDTALIVGLPDDQESWADADKLYVVFVDRVIT